MSPKPLDFPIGYHLYLPLLLLIPQFGSHPSLALPPYKPQISIDNALVLLHRYGYLANNHGVAREKAPGNPIGKKESVAAVTRLLDSVEDPSALKDPQGLYREAVRAFQRRYNLPVSGRLDKETTKLLSAPRCGNPDIITPTAIPQYNYRRQRGRSSAPNPRRVKRYLIGDPKMHWAKNKLTWQIRSFPTRNLNRSQTHAVFLHAFNKWSSVTNLDFVEEKDYYKETDIIIKFGAQRHGDSIPFDGPGGVLAHAFYPMPEPVYSLAGDAHFDDEENWSDGPHSEHRDLLSVATHELGHSMGLGHSSVPTSVMFPYYLRQWKRVELDQDDINGVQKIYGRPKTGKVLPSIPDLPDIPPIPETTTASPDISSLFDYCNTSVDAIIEVRGLELYIFKGEFQWRITWSKMVSNWISYQIRDGLTKIAYYWTVLPQDIVNIDAAIERHDSAIYIFKAACDKERAKKFAPDNPLIMGHQVLEDPWKLADVFNRTKNTRAQGECGIGNINFGFRAQKMPILNNRFWLLADNKNLADGCPPAGLSITQLGLPKSLRKVDAVFKWDVNKEVYVFAGDQYWLLDTRAHPPLGRVASAPDYPRRIRDTWRGIPIPVTAAYTTLNGETFFFRGNEYYVFDNTAMRARPDYPKPVRLEFIGCQNAMLF